MSRAWRISLLLLVSVLFCAFAVEFVVTLIFGEQVRFPRHVVGARFGVRINEPGAHYRHESADVSIGFRINAKGLRADRDYPYEKPPGIRRILTLGDSYTVGFEVEVEHTFSSVMERTLADLGYDVEVINAGVSGYGTAEAYHYLERELLRYAPDVVVLSFFGNDLVDNVRSNLFVLEGDELREGSFGYVPAGAIGNFLNTNAIASFLSERSNAFALLKEIATGLIKRQRVRANLEQLERAEADSRPAADERGYARRLTVAILERLDAATAGRGIPLVIQSIPTRLFDPLRLVELFPLEEFPVERDGVRFLPAKEILDAWLDRELLYYTRSQDHWTPRSHELSGKALAALIDEEGWLKRSPAGRGAGPQDPPG